MYRINKMVKLLQSSKKDWMIDELGEFWQIKNRNTLYTTIKRYVKRGMLFRVGRGLYSTRLTNISSVSIEDEKVIKARKMIKQKPYLVWYVKDYNQLSVNSILEAILGYGEWDDVLRIIQLWGKKKVRLVYRQITGKDRVNLRPETINYFNLYFNKYA
jgi:hypothetical protein